MIFSSTHPPDPDIELEGLLLVEKLEELLGLPPVGLPIAGNGLPPPFGDELMMLAEFLNALMTLTEATILSSVLAILISGT